MTSSVVIYISFLVCVLPTPAILRPRSTIRRFGQRLPARKHRSCEAEQRSRKYQANDRRCALDRFDRQCTKRQCNGSHLDTHLVRSFKNMRREFESTSFEGELRRPHLLHNTVLKKPSAYVCHSFDILSLKQLWVSIFEIGD